MGQENLESISFVALPSVLAQFVLEAAAISLAAVHSHLPRGPSKFVLLVLACFCDCGDRGDVYGFVVGYTML